MSSFSASLSGLNAEEQALSVISNDLSNLNTTGFKSQTPIFSDLFYQLLGSSGAGNPVQVGVGATMSSVASPFTQGNIQTTGAPTDVAIQGNGLFVLQQNGGQVYSRAGNFTLNPGGYLVDANGAFVMGYPAVNGTINANQTVQALTISSGQTYPPNATSEIQLDMNLDATATLATTAAETLTLASAPADGDTVTVGATTYTFKTALSATPTADEVLIGLNGATSALSNLAAAIKLTGTAGTNYGTGTTANASATATAAGRTLTLQALAAGTAGNIVATTTHMTGGLLASGTLTGGAAPTAATGSLTLTGAPADGDTVSVGATTYTFKTALSAAPTANEVLIGLNGATTALTNLAAAIDGTGTIGTDYGTGTTTNISATATALGSTLSLQAIATGIAGNTVATTTTVPGVSFASGTLTGGLASTAAAGSLTLASAPSSGDTVTVGATTYTFASVLSNSGNTPDEVLIGTNGATSALSNLAAAIKLTGTGGTNYGRGTTANASATATASGSTLTLQAITPGTVGNTVATTANMTGGLFASGTLTGGTASGGSYSTPITVFDSLGSNHVLTVNFTKVSSGNWAYQITIPALDVGATGAPQVVGSGTLQFDLTGNLISPASDVTGITVTGLADGASPLNLTWQLFSTLGTPFITQTAQASATSSKQQNGYGAGTLQSYSIDSTGIINGVLSNSQTVALGQIALATFPNSDGLTRLGKNDYAAGLGSGLPSVGTPGSGGRGSVDGGSLEQSNVDIASEFTQLIIAERGYQANAKAITTADTVMQAAINLKQ